MTRIYGQWSDLLTALAVVALLGAFLGVFAFSSATDTANNDAVDYQLTGEFSYSASVRDPDLFDGGRVTTGDPLFVSQSSQAEFAYAQRLTSAGAASVGMTGRLIAELGELSGWKRTIALQESAAADGPALQLSGTIDLTEVRQFMAQFVAGSGVEYPAFTLTIIAQTTTTGLLGGARIEAPHAPRMTFRADAAGFRLQEPDGSAEADPLKPERAGTVETLVRERARLSLGPVTLSVTTARAVAISALSVAAVAAAALMAVARQRGRGSEPERAFANLGVSVVPVADAAAARGALATVAVAHLDDLAKIALRDGSPVLGATGHESARRFTVFSQGIAYEWSPETERLARGGAGAR